MPVIGPIIAAAGAALSRLLFSRLGAWITTALIFIGLELATGAVVVQSARDAAEAGWLGIPPDIAAWMGVLQLDRYATIILSAYVAAVVKRVIFRKRAAA